MNVESPEDDENGWYNEINSEICFWLNTDWKYEEEVRVISTFNLKETTIHKEPYDIHLFKVPHSAICEIILGVNIEKSIETKIRAFAVEKKINIYKAKISDTEFDMERE